MIADIGSGTGIFAKQIIKKGSYVYCIEPNKDMRDQSLIELKQYKNKAILNGEAACTTLPKWSVDFITAAQSFHWFETDLFKKECARIIKPRGKVLLIWNIFDLSSVILKRCSKIHKKYSLCSNNANKRIQKDDERIKFFFDNQYERLVFDNPLHYSKHQFICRFLSSSYSLKYYDNRFENYKSELEALFEEYANDGLVSLSNQTVAYIGSVNT